ncbi:hypothetical protein ECG_02601 [Echinococcus granulosus]|nr:hypothetical protein ECG_02601 [Echinococcus granulosus]
MFQLWWSSVALKLLVKTLMHLLAADVWTESQRMKGSGIYEFNNNRCHRDNSTTSSLSVVLALISVARCSDIIPPYGRFGLLCTFHGSLSTRMHMPVPLGGALVLQCTALPFKNVFLDALHDLLSAPRQSF